MWIIGMMQSGISCDGLIGTEMDDKSEGTAALGESISVTGWNGGFSISIGDLIKDTGYSITKRKYICWCISWSQTWRI